MELFSQYGFHLLRSAWCKLLTMLGRSKNLQTSTAVDLFENQFVSKFEQNSKCNVNCFGIRCLKVIKLQRLLYLFGSMLKSLSALLAPFYLYYIPIESSGKLFTIFEASNLFNLNL